MFAQLLVILATTVPPTLGIEQVQPATGPTSGGTYVTITGSGLTTPAQVSFGTASAIAVVSGGSNTIHAWSPPYASGSTQITVVTSSGTSAPGPSTLWYYNPGTDPV